jgi:hypothetical protein
VKEAIPFTNVTREAKTFLHSPYAFSIAFNYTFSLLAAISINIILWLENWKENDYLEDLAVDGS